MDSMKFYTIDYRTGILNNENGTSECGSLRYVGKSIPEEFKDYEVLYQIVELLSSDTETHENPKVEAYSVLLTFKNKFTDKYYKEILPWEFRFMYCIDGRRENEFFNVLPHGILLFQGFFDEEIENDYTKYTTTARKIYRTIFNYTNLIEAFNGEPHRMNGESLIPLKLMRHYLKKGSNILRVFDLEKEQEILDKYNLGVGFIPKDFETYKKELIEKDKTLENCISDDVVYKRYVDSILATLQLILSGRIHHKSLSFNMQ